MLEIKNSIGNVTKVFADTFEDRAYDQLKKIANYEPYLNSKIRIMPDAHSGKGCMVGTTMTISGQAITPNIIGTDIGCGMLVAYLDNKDIDLSKLDHVIREYVPSGSDAHDKPIADLDLSDLVCYKDIDTDHILRSIGTLGGGNHFIELDKASDGTLILVIHTGSRHLGMQVCEHFQKIAINNLRIRNDIKELIAKLKSEGRQKEIQTELKKLKPRVIDEDLAYVTGKDFDDYINDMRITQRYATVNRCTILYIICQQMGFTVSDHFDTVHNYIDMSGDMMVRKGAVSAQNGERLIIPLNMRDGSLICIGKGNQDWNCSAPHGAGRLMSRFQARKNITMDEFSDAMHGIYTTSVNEGTIDEAPQAYKSSDEIMRLVKDTVDIIDVVKPIYNFKASKS